MIKGQRVVAIIPARGGSKGVPRKNLQPVGGKPLLTWSIEIAQAVPELDEIFVSTDCEETAEITRQSNCDVRMRPAPLASDTALPKELVEHHLVELGNENRTPVFVLYLQPTSPFRSVEDVRACLLPLEDETIDSIASFTTAKLNPLEAWRIEDGIPQGFIENAEPWSPDQRLPQTYQLNGAVYAFRVARFLALGPPGFLFGKGRATLMPYERSFDIDTPMDILHAEVMLAAAAET